LRREGEMGRRRIDVVERDKWSRARNSEGGIKKKQGGAENEIQGVHPNRKITSNIGIFCRLSPR
jgi:hypothetical protein